MNNDRIIVEVFCPVISGKYDFVLDPGMTAGEAAEKIAEEVKCFENNDIIFSGEALLYSSGHGLPLDPSETLENYGVTSGSRLMLIQE